MSHPLGPAQEQRRREALARLQVLDTAPEPAFDALVQAAAALCGTPLSLLSLIDEDRQWFKARHGLPDATQTPREDALCAHAIACDELLEVPDATHDPRFAGSALVRGAPHVVFYAGAPVRVEGGAAIGALCVIDHRPRRLDAHQREVLCHLARAAAQALEGRRALLAEREQRNLALRAAAVLAHSVDAIVTLDLDGRITHWNGAAEGLFGHAAAQMLGQSVARLLPPGCPPAEARPHGMLAQHPAGCTYDTERLHADGSVLAVSVSLAPILDASGETVGATKIVRDRRSQARAARELAASEARFRALSDAAPLGIFATDATGACTYTNARWQSLYGLSAEAALGQGWSTALHPEDRVPVVTMWQRCAAAGGDFDHEFRILRPQGEERHVRARACPMHDEQGLLVGHVGAVEDVTELGQARRAAEAAARAKAEFLASTSHEIRTPLNAILGLTHLLEHEGLPSCALAQVRRIGGAGRLLLALVNDVLDLSRIEAGQLALNVHDFDLHGLLADTMALLGAGAPRPDVQMHLSIDEAVPRMVRGDATRLSQVLHNLLGNALKFTERGRVALQVHMGAAPGEVVLEVSDTGIGIEPEVQARLFRPFEQADASTTRRYGGSGLGLSISARLVGLMEGRIALRSEPGQGSTFSVTLPLPAVTLPGAMSTQDPGDFEWLAGVQVWVVDDNALNLDVARQVLALEGAQVRTFDSGPAVLAALSALPPDCDARPGEAPAAPDALLLDVQMPGMDGLQVVRALRAVPALRNLPVIALSAGAFSDERAAALAAGMSEFLPKPLEPRRAVELLRAQVRRWRGQAPSLRPRRRPARGGGDVSVAPPLAVEGLDEASVVPALRADRPLLLRLLAGLLRENADIAAAPGAAQPAWLQQPMAAEWPPRLHKLKGGAGVVGATVVAHAAALAESAATEPARAEALQALRRALRALGAAAAPVLAAEPGPASPAPGTAPPPDAAAWAELRTLLAQQNVRAAARVEAQAAGLATALGAERLARLRQALAEFDFHTAAAQLTEVEADR